MVSSLAIEQRFGWTAWKIGRLAQLLLLGTSQLAAGIMSMNIANSLFLNHVGAENLPLCFIFLGLFSAIAYAAVSQLVDRNNPLRLFQYTLLVSAAIAVGLRLLLGWGTLPVYYLISIAAFFQTDLYSNILYPNLLSAYFTTLEYKRYASFIGIAQAIGILLGGALTKALLHFVSTENLLLCLCAIYALAIAQLVYLNNTQRLTDVTTPPPKVNLLESLTTLPDLVKRYPLVFYLASSSFLFIIIYIISEFLWFSIYAQNYTGDALTNFLAQIRIVTSLAQLLVLYCFTRPLLQWLGVGRMNLVFPVTTLAAFFGLAFQSNLGLAIAVNINGDSFDKGINKPVHQLNYNAIPGEFSSRVRALSDGVFYAAGLTLAGIFLWVSHQFLSLTQVTWIGIGLACVLLLLRWPMGRLYAGGLETMIRSNSLNLDEFPLQLPAQSSTAIRELLQQSDRYTQIKGLELAANSKQPSQFLPEVFDLLPEADTSVRRAVVRLFGTQGDDEAMSRFSTLLESQNPDLRATAVAIAIANRYPFAEKQIRSLLTQENPELLALGIVAATQAGTTHNPQIRSACELIWPEIIPTGVTEVVLEAIDCSQNRELIPLLRQIVVRGNGESKRIGLAILARLAQANERELAEIAVAELSNGDPQVRAAAYQLLGVTRCKGMLRHLGAGLADSDPRVRQSVMSVLGAYGQAGLVLVQDSLSSRRPEEVRGAIAVLGRVGTRQASDILYDYIAPDLQEVGTTFRWQQQIPVNDPNWEPLAIAIADYHQRLIDRVLYILSCLGYSRTVDIVKRILISTNSKEVANAIEVLASLPHRRFVLPLLPVLEQLGTPSEGGNRARVNLRWLRDKGYKILIEALDAKDRWIQSGAIVALATVPAALLRTPDPIVKTVTQQMFPFNLQRPSVRNALMNRLLLLKSVPLFEKLSLDELLAIDQMLEQEQYLSGQTILTEGNWNTYLYIVAEGSVRILKDIDGEQREIRQLYRGQYFGELALFDDAPNWEGAIALQDCTLLKLEKSRFISLIGQKPHIILEICRFLSQRLRETDKFRSNHTKLLPAAEGEATNYELPTTS